MWEVLQDHMTSLSLVPVFRALRSPWIVAGFLSKHQWNVNIYKYLTPQYRGLVNKVLQQDVWVFVCFVAEIQANNPGVRVVHGREARHQNLRHNVKIIGGAPADSGTNPSSPTVGATYGTSATTNHTNAAFLYERATSDTPLEASLDMGPFVRQGFIGWVEKRYIRVPLSNGSKYSWVPL